jgi:hypothetical protein
LNRMYNPVNQQVMRLKMEAMVLFLRSLTGDSDPALWVGHRERNLNVHRPS